MFEQMLAKLEERPPSVPISAVSSVAVVGADPIGQSLACAALRAGCDVTLHSTFGSESRKLTDAKELAVQGGSLAGSYTILGTTDAPRRPGIRLVPELDLAVKDADIIVLAVPAFAHASYAALLAPVLRPNQAIVLAPGQSLGALEVARFLRTHRLRDDVVVMELCAAPYLVTQPQPGRLIVEAEHKAVLAAALSSVATKSLTATLQSVFPMLRPAMGVLHTSFANMAGLLVAAPALLAASAPGKASVRDRLPASLVDSVITRLDQERRRTAFAYGVRDLASFTEWLELAFGTVEKDAVNALNEVAAFGRIACPSADDLVVRDAVGACLVPIMSAGELAGVQTPTTSALINLASSLHGFDHLRHGRTFAGLGLNSMRPDEIRRALDGAETRLAQEVLFA
jgi:opine dehydrogenase